MRKFFIVSSQRSGTTWFCEKIAGMFGRWGVSEETNINWWEEASNETFIERKKLHHHCVPKPSFIIEKGYATKMLTLEAFEIFGINKVVWKTEKFYSDAFDSLGDNEFVNVMYDQCSINAILKYPIIHFIRRDTSAQATSNLIAQQTGIYHNNNHYADTINNLTDVKLDLNYDNVFHDSVRLNWSKEVYYDTLKRYHKNCLTVFYEDCLDESYWKNILNKKLENFMQDSIQNADYETENKKTRKLFEITNSDGGDWEGSNFTNAINFCEKNNLPVNSDGLARGLKFKGK